MAEGLTVIVVALLGGEALDQCLQAVRGQCSNLLVVRRDGTIVDGNGRTVGVADRLDIPAKRRSAVELAATPLVALIEDTVVPHAGWADAITAALSQVSVVACGGPVRIATGLPAQTRALTLSEYGRFNERVPPGEAKALPGCNFAFRREALLDAMPASEGLIDLPVFDRLKEMGRLVWAPEASVIFVRPWPEGARFRTRFDHGRVYGSSASNRVLTAAKAPFLPAVLTARTLNESGRVDLSTLRWLVAQHIAWAAGEFTGAVLGPGEGLGGWR